MPSSSRLLTRLVFIRMRKFVLLTNHVVNRPNTMLFTFDKNFIYICIIKWIECILDVKIKTEVNA